MKTVVHHGEVHLKPQWESQCVVDIVSDDCDGTNEVDNDPPRYGGKNVTVTLGQSNCDFMRNIESCVMTMSKGETSKFIFEISETESLINAGSDNVQSEEQSEKIPVNKRKVSTTIILHSFSLTPPSWKLSSEEKYKLALSYKTQGSELFQSGKIEAAFNHYSRAVKYLICTPELSTVSESGLSDMAIECSVPLKELRALQCVCYLNLAACQARVSNHAGVVRNCTQALVLDAGSVKALYRRAVAHMACGQKETARY